MKKIEQRIKDITDEINEAMEYVKTLKHERDKDDVLMSVEGCLEHLYIIYEIKREKNTNT